MKRQADGPPGEQRGHRVDGETIPLSAATIVKAYAPTKARKLKKHSSQSRFFRHLLHCCCRENDIGAAMLAYLMSRDSFLGSAREKRGLGEYPSLSYGSTSGLDSLTEDVLCQAPLTPSLVPPRLSLCIVDPDFSVEMQSFASLMSLCDGVSPTDYLQSGAVNKPPPSVVSHHAPTTLPNSPSPILAGATSNDHTSATVPVLPSTHHLWDDDVLSVYDLLHKLSLRYPSLLTPTSRYNFANQLASDMAYLGFSYTEICYTGHIRVACHAGEDAAAESLLDRAVADKTCKKRNRLFYDLLVHYSTASLSKFTALWSTLLDHNLCFTEQEYIVAMDAATHFQDVVLAQKTLNDIGEDVLVPSTGLRNSIVSWFSSLPLKNDSSETTLVSLPENLRQHQSPMLTKIFPQCSYEVSSPTAVSESGTAPGILLRSISLTEKQRQSLLAMNTEIVLKGSVTGHDSDFQGGRKGKKRAHDEVQRSKEWGEFLGAMKSKVANGQMWDVVIDGANVGFYKPQNSGFRSPGVEWCQIDWVVRDFERRGLKCVVVLHARHFNERGKMAITAAGKAIVRDWARRGVWLVKTPMSANDDWFWLHASLWGGRVQGDEGEGRVEGLPLFVSNDELRDHRFMMLAARNLFRWKERRAVKFGFGEWKQLPPNTEWPGTSRGSFRQPLFTFPKEYSVRVQGDEGGALFIPMNEEGRTWLSITVKSV